MLSRIVSWLAERRNRQWIAVGLLVVALLIVVSRLLRLPKGGIDPRNEAFIGWWTASYEERLKLITARREVCPGAPFILPADGYIGLLYGDPRPPYSSTHLHQGIDIFGTQPLGQTPVISAYPGFLTRLADWKSSVIVRVPQDPLQPGRQIWLYYTHMADERGTSFIAEDFPAGSHEVPVAAGTLLGHQGDYSGDPNNPVGIHLHFSVVRDDGLGSFRNELEFGNTLPLSPYLGLPLEAGEARTWPVACP